MIRFSSNQKIGEGESNFDDWKCPIHSSRNKFLKNPYFNSAPFSWVHPTTVEHGDTCIVLIGVNLIIACFYKLVGASNVRNLGTFKVHVFKEGHKNWRNIHRRFDIM